MSKPESTGAKSLEEILASIRKSLADEPTEPRITPAKAAQPQPQPQPLTQAQPRPAAPLNGPARSNGLSNKLASALNGSANGSAPDADLSDLLAAETKKPTPTAPIGGDKPANATSGDEKDPLWFLSRLSGAASGPDQQQATPQQQGSAARARDAAKAPVPVEEVKLSRPETLRPSLPPLFDGNAQPVSPSTIPAKEKPADFVSKTARTEPRTIPSHANGAAHAPPEAAKAEPEAPTAVTTPASEASPTATAPTVPAPIKAAEPATEETAPKAGISTEPAGIVESDNTKASAETFPAGGPMPEAAPQPRALEQTVAELLEPVIRQWLQANLPRLIEKAVREEVARVVAERPAGKV